MGELWELAAAYIAGRLARGELSPASAKVDTTRLRSLLRVHGDRPASALDRSTLLAWQETIGRYEPATRKAYLCTVQTFCRWLTTEGHLPDDPSARLTKPRLPRRPPRALPAPAIQATLAACRNTRERLIVRLEVSCGLRAIEVSRLDLDDYDPYGGTLWVRGKFGNERQLPVPVGVARAILEYMPDRGSRPGPLILAVGSKATPDRRLSAHWISKLVASRMTEAGVHRPGDNRSGHALRHTCATAAFGRSKDLPAVQQLLGHRSLATTERYLGVADLGRIRAALEDPGLPAPA